MTDREEIVTIKITMSTLKDLHSKGLISSSDYEVKHVDEEYVYTDDPTWQQLKKESSKAYRKLKDREYDIRWKQKP